jgi:hypothetical protein
MRKLIFFAFVFIANFFCLVCVSNADENKTATLQLGKLIELQKQTVQSYEGYKINVNWVGGKPMINIVQQQVDITNKKVKSQEIVQIGSKNSSAEQKNIEQELISLQTFKPTSWGEADNVSDENGNKLLRFNAYDDKGIMRLSEWRNAQNGFDVETLIFSDDGKLISMFFYYKLRINQSFSEICSDKKYKETFEHSLEKFGPVNSDDSQDVIRFCEAILDKVLSKNHD